MTSKLLAQLLADLGVTKSFSRPHVSDDNPFSESRSGSPVGVAGRGRNHFAEGGPDQRRGGGGAEA